MPKQSLSRRGFMQTSAMLAAAFAAQSGLPRSAYAAREKELNILCWEGYNSAQVLDPFRSANAATVKAEVADQRPDDDQPAPGRGDQRVGFDQCEQSLGAQDHVPREADQAARSGADGALFREDAAGVQATL